MKLNAVTREAKLILIGIPVLIWTLLPIYHLALFAFSPKDEGTTGKLPPRYVYAGGTSMAARIPQNGCGWRAYASRA